MSARRIYLAQHGLAVDKSIDPERPLSEQGVTQTQAIAEQLHHAGISITRIFHSGKLRARQTAEIFASILAVDDVAVVNGFSPNDDVEQSITQLTTEDALYIGHLPHLDRLASLLVSGHETSSVCHFQNSAVLFLENREQHYGVSGYLTPALATSQS